MDEPTSGLDPLMQKDFDELVGELRDGGATVFLSSHNLSEVERVCERVAIIRDGRLVTVETVDEILGRAFRRVSLQFAGPVDPAEFAALPGVSDLAADGNRLAFKLSGAESLSRSRCPSWSELHPEAFVAPAGGTSVGALIGCQWLPVGLSSYGGGSGYFLRACETRRA